MGQQPPFGGPGQFGQQPPMGPPQPPKKSRTGLVVGVVVAVVAVAAFAVTGFVAPGFLVSDDKDSGGTATEQNGDGGSDASGGDGGGDDPASGGGGEGDDSGGGGDTGGGGGGEGGGGGDAAALVDQIVQGFVDQDEELLNGLVCPGAETAIRAYTEEAEFVQSFELQGEVEESGKTATAKVYAKLQSGDQKAEGEVTITVADEGAGWCWKDMED